jgi:hypothetical protein
MLIDDSEKEDFENTILEKGLNVSDFEVTEQRDPMRCAGVQPMTGTVKILRKSTRREKIYTAGHGTSWPADFSDDLDHGLFS